MKRETSSYPMFFTSLVVHHPIERASVPEIKAIGLDVYTIDKGTPGSPFGSPYARRITIPHG
jgi:hypothetical protein